METQTKEVRLTDPVVEPEGCFGFDIKESWDVIRRVLRHYCGCSNIDYMIRSWEQNKAGLMRLFPPTGRIVNKITEAPTLSIDDLHDGLHSTIHPLYTKLVCKIPETEFDVIRLAQVIGERMDYLLLYGLSPLEVANGKLMRDKESYQKGTKIAKYIRGKMEHYLANDWSFSRKLALVGANSVLIQKCIDCYITALSQFQQTIGKNVYDVYIVLSVNPLDILMASEHGIRSCHRLDGEYCTGTLAYITDEATAIGYVYRDVSEYDPAGDLLLPRRIWRQLVEISPDLDGAFFMRQYPFTSEAYAKEVRRLTAYALANYLGEEPRWTLYRRQKGDVYRGDDGKGYFYLDDVSTTIILKTGTGEEEEDDYTGIEVAVGGPVVCPCCGEVRDDYDEYGDGEHHSSLLCWECGEWGKVACYNCDGLFDREDMVIGPGDVWYCEDCFNELFARCFRCENTVSVDDITYVGATPYCMDCYDELFVRCSHCYEAVPVDDALDYDDDYYCQSCFEDLFAYCLGCRDHHPIEDGTEINGDWYCQSCIDELFAECYSCGEQLPKSDMELVNGHYYCSDCVAELGEVLEEAVSA